MSPPFAHLLGSYQPRVHRAALGLLGDEQEAREVAQEALAKAWTARDRYDPSRAFYPWLYTIVRNLCRDARDRRRHRAFSGLESDRVVSRAPSPLAQASASQSRERVRRAMDQLPDPQREILAMRHFQDLTYAEIGELLQIPQGTVMSRLFRARRALLALIEEGP